MNKSFLALYVVIASSLAAAASAWFASKWIVSPADVAAQTAPPQPSPILVPIEKRVLSSRIITRGTARYGLPQQVNLPPSNLKPKSGLVTTLPKLNTVVRDGDALLTASGRPVFVLAGKLTTYRDLTPGLSGADILQLEQALRRLGHDPGPVDGKFDEKTSAAVQSWYMAEGIEPFGPTPAQIKAVKALEQQLVAAQKAQISATSAEAVSALAIKNARSIAERNDKAAAADLAAKSVALQRLKGRLKSNNTSAASGEGQTGGPHKAAALETAKATAKRNNIAAAAALAEKEDALQRLQESVRAKISPVEVAKRVAAHNYRVALDALKLERKKGQFMAKSIADANIDRARLAVEKVEKEGELAVLNAERDAKTIDYRIAQAKKLVELARAALKSTRLEGERAVKQATVDSSVASGELRSAMKQLDLAEAAITSVRLEGQLAIQKAKDAAKFAKFDAEQARRGEEAAKAALERELRRIGFQVPVDEVIFLPELPVRVHEIKAAIGDEAKGALLAVTDNKLSIDSSLTLESAKLVKTGMDVMIDEQAAGVRAKGKVAFVADRPGTRGMDGYHRYMNVEVIETNVPIEKYSLRLTIPVKSTAGEKIVVPVTALSLATDGKSQIQVQRNGRIELVPVEPGLSADGFVEVAPEKGELRAGQLVVVGFENPASN